MVREWQRRRSEFNHDWLKNRFRTSLDSWVNSLEQQAEDPEREAAFLSEVLPAWETRVGEALRLAEDFEREMSPRVLFSELPLSRCGEEIRRWLPDLVHALWLERHQVRTLVEDVLTAARAADSAYISLTQALENDGKTRSTKELGAYRSQFVEFRNLCKDLCKAIERFPNRILAI